MKQQTFENLHGERWTTFAQALADLEDPKRMFRKRAASDLEDFVDGYRALCRDLAIAKKRGYSSRLISRLNDLVIRGHNAIYVRRSGFARAALEFGLRDFPRLVRAEWRYVLAATLLFVGPGLGMWAAMSVAPEIVYSVLSPGQLSMMETMYDPAAEHIGRERQSDTDFAMFGYYIWNNISISFRMFATGLTLGLGTVIYLVYNGLVIGTVAAHLTMIGYHETFFPFVLGHGSFELTAIVIAGAAGLMIGVAMIAPGRFTRLESLRRRGRIAIQIILGTTAMLLVTAFIEAFWSSIGALPAIVKYTVGALLWSIVIIYFAWFGRQHGSG
ncbi:MAG: stage II sporulation protein M [Gammaproteobacteria bacterium]|nr:stage II sporulation protein M [Gammaproteobacteria bacterium]